MNGVFGWKEACTKGQYAHEGTNRTEETFAPYLCVDSVNFSYFMNLSLRKSSDITLHQEQSGERQDLYNSE